MWVRSPCKMLALATVIHLNQAKSRPTYISQSSTLAPVITLKLNHNFCCLCLLYLTFLIWTNMHIFLPPCTDNYISCDNVTCLFTACMASVKVWRVNYFWPTRAWIIFMNWTNHRAINLCGTQMLASFSIIWDKQCGLLRFTLFLQNEPIQMGTIGHRAILILFCFTFYTFLNC